MDDPTLARLTQQLRSALTGCRVLRQPRLRHDRFEGIRWIRYGTFNLPIVGHWIERQRVCAWRPPPSPVMPRECYITSASADLITCPECRRVLESLNVPLEDRGEVIGGHRRDAIARLA